MLAGLLASALYSCSATGASRVASPEPTPSLALELSRSECDIQAYARDPEPASIVLRGAPQEDAESIAQLPSENAIELTVAIAAVQDRWVKVKRATSEAGRSEFVGQGWAHAEQFGLRTKGYDSGSVPLYDSASDTSRTIATLPADYPVTLVSCARDWVKIKTETQQGWLAPRDQCANPYTTCS